MALPRIECYFEEHVRVGKRSCLHLKQSRKTGSLKGEIEPAGPLASKGFRKWWKGIQAYSFHLRSQGLTGDQAVWCGF